MITHTHICIARREQFMTCKDPLVFTALALARITKWKKPQVPNVEGLCISMAISTHIQWLAILFWRKLLTKSALNDLFISEAEHESQSYLAACVWEKTLPEKSSGVLFWGRLPVRWGWWWVLLAALFPEKVPGGLLPRAESRYQWEAAAHLPDNIKSRARAPSGDAAWPARDGKRFPCASRGAGNKVITNRLILLPAPSGNTGLAFSRSKSNPIRKGFSDKMHHWL